MNEQIQELANELGPIATIGNWGRVEWKDNVYPQLGDKLYAAIDLQKFAELIVRECAELSVNSQYAHTKSEYYEGFNEALIYAGNKIKQHFGVE